MNKLISFRYPDWKNRWEFFVDWDTKVVTVIVTFISDFRPAPEFGIGTAMRSPEDEFDLRVGVPLALKRALGKIVAVDRPALTKRFFRQWPEAHSEYKTHPDKNVVFKLDAQRRAEAVLSAVIEENKEKRGRFKIGGLGTVPSAEEMANMRVLVRTGEKTAVLHVPLCERCFVFHVDPLCP